MSLSKNMNCNTNTNTKQKQREEIEDKKTAILIKSVQKVEIQGKRGKIKNATTHITDELLEYIKENMNEYSLLMISYIILGILISIRKLLLNTFSETDTFLNDRLGLAKLKYSNSKPHAKTTIKKNINNKELSPETLRTLFNKSLLSEFEKIKSSKFHLSQDLFDKIKNTIFKMKLPSIMGMTQKDIKKYEQENIINPLFKQFTQPLHKGDNINLNDTNKNTQNFANLVGIDLDMIINKETAFPENNDINIDQEYQEINNDFSSPQKILEVELIKKIREENNTQEKNNINLRKDKEFFEYDIDTYLEMIKDESEDMSLYDIKNIFNQNLSRVRKNDSFRLFKENLSNNFPKIQEESFELISADLSSKLIDKMNIEYSFYGNGRDYVAILRNENNASDQQRFEKSLSNTQIMDFNLEDERRSVLEKTSIHNSQIKEGKMDLSQFPGGVYDERQDRMGIQIKNKIIDIIKESKYYRNVNLDTFVDSINKDDNILVDEFGLKNEKTMKSFIFYNLLICCQANGINLQQNNLFSDFFFVKD